jgi:hypothetical protein
MSATAAMILQVRGWVNEPDDTTYDDDAITVFIERYPLLDERGEVPYTWDTSTPPVQEANEDWIPTYDLHAAAADVWTEKATIVAADFDFQADGGNYSRSQVYEAYMSLARHHQARRKPGVITLHMHPKETDVLDEDLSN